MSYLTPRVRTLLLAAGARAATAAGARADLIVRGEVFDAAGTSLIAMGTARTSTTASLVATFGIMGDFGDIAATLTATTNPNGVTASLSSTFSNNVPDSTQRLVFEYMVTGIASPVAA
jgi:hypothetical protein